MAYETHKILVASTAHITPEIAKAADDPNTAWGPAFVRNSIPYCQTGWMFYVPMHGTPELRDTPTPLINLFQVAINQGCQWLMLDSDGPLLDELPTFEW